LARHLPGFQILDQAKKTAAKLDVPMNSERRHPGPVKTVVIPKWKVPTIEKKAETATQKLLYPFVS
jgi:hypothetical protein